MSKIDLTSFDEFIQSIKKLIILVKEKSRTSRHNIYAPISGLVLIEIM